MILPLWQKVHTSQNTLKVKCTYTVLLWFAAYSMSTVTLWPLGPLASKCIMEMKLSQQQYSDSFFFFLSTLSLHCICHVNIGWTPFRSHKHSSAQDMALMLMFVFGGLHWHEWLKYRLLQAATVKFNRSIYICVSHEALHHQLFLSENAFESSAK